MFERFTDRARRVLVLAQDEARLLDHPFIGTEHLLLGLLRDEESDAAAAVREAGLSLAGVRAEVRRRSAAGSGRGQSSPPFTPRAAKVLEQALRSAAPGERQVGPEHLLVALIDDGEGLAAQILAGATPDLQGLTRRVRESASGPGTGTKARPSAIGRFGVRHVPAAGQPGPPADAAVQDTVAAVHMPDGWPEPLAVTGVEPDAVHLQVEEDGRVHGSVHGLALRARLDGPGRRAGLTGSLAGGDISGWWDVGDNSGGGPVTARAGAHGGGLAAALRGTFHLGPRFFFGRADLHGELGGQPLRAQAVRAHGGEHRAAVAVLGTLGPAAVVLFAAVAGDHDRAWARGVVGDCRVAMDLVHRPDGPRGAAAIDGIGGPSPAVALGVAGALLYFM